MASDRIRRIVNQFIADMEQAVRLDVQEELKRILDGMTQPKSASPARAKAAPSPPKKKRSYPPHCKHPDCTEPHKGPGRSFLCQRHYDEQKAAKEGGAA